MTPISVCRTGCMTWRVARRGWRKPGRSHARPIRQAGFTLLELLLVLTIIGMASLLIVPNVGNLEVRTFSAQVRQATSLLNYARRTAVVQGLPAVATFHAQSAEDEARPRQPVTGNVGNWESYGSAIRYRDSADRELEVEEKIDISFYPEGGSSGGTLILTRDDQTVRISVNPFTGQVTTEYEAEQ